jgi:hypothetical protein
MLKAWLSVIVAFNLSGAWSSGCPTHHWRLQTQGCMLLPSYLVHRSQRKSTLLVEYKQLKKANAFVDRRFGGVQLRCTSLSSIVHTYAATFHFIVKPVRLSLRPSGLHSILPAHAEYDDSLTEEEKAIARFQKERLKKARQRAHRLTLHLSN